MRIGRAVIDNWKKSLAKTILTTSDFFLWVFFLSMLISAQNRTFQFGKKIWPLEKLNMFIIITKTYFENVKNLEEFYHAVPRTYSCCSADRWEIYNNESHKESHKHLCAKRWQRKRILKTVSTTLLTRTLCSLENVKFSFGQQHVISTVSRSRRLKFDARNFFYDSEIKHIQFFRTRSHIPELLVFRPFLQDKFGHFNCK